MFRRCCTRGTQTHITTHADTKKNEKIALDAYLGAGFALDGKSHLYTNEPNSNFDIVNTGIKASKNITVLQYKLPVSAVAMWNPTLKIARVQLGVVLF